MAVYLDASAFVKAVLKEPETGALKRFLARHQRWVSSALLRAEGLRAARRHGAAAMLTMRRSLQLVDLVVVDSQILEAAGAIEPAAIRTLDAVHLATAMEVGDDLELLVTYDARMAEAAAANGIATASPR